MLADDRDLLVLEPNLFRDLVWIAQRVVSGTGSVTGTTLTMTAQDTGFDAAGVDAGAVVTVDGASYEVVQRVSASVLTVSRPRAAVTDPAIPPLPASARPVAVMTFRPQLALAQRRVLRLLGLEPGQSGVTPPGTGAGLALGEGALLNPEAARLATALDALHQIYAAAAAAGARDSFAAGRAEWYRARFEAERGRVRAQLDTDGDGTADTLRTLNASRWVRG